MSLLKLKLNWVGLAVILLSSVSQADVERVPRCSGGDGPHPLVDVSADVSSFISVIPTGRGIREFALTPENNEIVFRQDNQNIFVSSTSDLSILPKMLTSSAKELDHFTAPQARFLTAKNAPWLFDRAQNYWLKLLPEENNFTHLFWKEASLYSYATRKVPNSHLNEYRIYRYQSGIQSAQRICKVRNVQLAMGHHYPYVHFYRTEPSPIGSLLEVLQLDVTKCAFTKEIVFQAPIEGTVLEVHRFDSLNATLVRTNHSSTNLMWQTSRQGCRYFDLHGATPLVFNYHTPMIASFSRELGLRLVDLSLRKMTQLFPMGVELGLSAEHLALSNNGKFLYLSPLNEMKSQSRSLLRLDLTSFNSIEP